MHNSLVEMGNCKKKISAGRSGGKAAAASHSGESRVGGEEKRQSERTELIFLLCVYVIIGVSDEGQCIDSHQHFNVTILNSNSIHFTNSN